jgi:membrane associated rhomboid family serine protease
MVSPFSVAALAVAVAIPALFWWRKGYIVQGLVLANFAVFILMLVAGTVAGAPFGTIAGTPFLEDLAFRASDLGDGNPLAFFKIFTAAFLHADLLHVLGNMLILLMVGLAFEDRVGRGRFLVLYLFTAFTAVLLHVIYTYLTEGGDAMSIPLVGASGAVFGILGAFATMYPHDRIPMFLVFIILPRVPVIVAAIVLMLLEGLLLFSGPPGTVARAAHLGGAIGGAALAPLLKPRQETGAAPGGRPLDMHALEEQATTPTQQSYLVRLKENLDEPDTARAWLERLLLSFECSQCGARYTDVNGPRARCPVGHEVRYDRKK